MASDSRIRRNEDEDEEPLEIPLENNKVNEQATLCLIGRVWTRRTVNTFGLIETMKKLWNPTRGMTCREIAPNLISFQFNHWRDVDKVLEREPWQFNNFFLMLQRASMDVPPTAMKFDSIPCWIRLYDLPMAGRTPQILQMVGSRFGKVMEIDESTTDGLSRCVRLKVVLTLSKPLKRRTMVRLGAAEPLAIPVKYERLPTFCYFCGVVGHNAKDCDVIQTEEDVAKMKRNDMEYEDFLRASPWKKDKVVIPENNTYSKQERKELFRPKQRETEEAEEEEKADPMKIPDEKVVELMKSLTRVEMKPHQVTSETKPNLSPSINSYDPPVPTSIPNQLYQTIHQIPSLLFQHQPSSLAISNVENINISISQYTSANINQNSQPMIPNTIMSQPKFSLTQQDETENNSNQMNNPSNHKPLEHALPHPNTDLRRDRIWRKSDSFGVISLPKQPTSGKRSLQLDDDDLN